MGVLRNSSGEIIFMPKAGVYTSGSLASCTSPSGSFIKFNASAITGGNIGYAAKEDGSSIVPDTTSNVIYAILAYGQSNSNGTSSAPPQTTVNPAPGHTFFFGSDGRGPWNDTSTLYDFSAQTSFDTLDSGGREIVTASVCKHLSDIAQGVCNTQFFDLVTWSSGSGGQPYSALKKGTNRWTNFLGSVSAAKRIATDTLGKTLIVLGVVWVQGENNVSDSETTYRDYLLELETDIQADIKPITGQTADIKLIIPQISNWAMGYATVNDIRGVPLAQLAAAETRPDTILLASPMYLGATLGSGNLHYTGPNTVRWAQGIANVFESLIIRRDASWTPLKVSSVNRVGATVTLTYAVQQEPLVLDTTTITNYADGHYGFSYRDDVGTVSISSVALSGTNQVVITLSSSTLGANPQILVGPNETASPTVCGITVGPRCCLRDSFSATALECNFAAHQIIDL